MKFISNLLIFLLFLFFINCQPGFHNRERIYRDQNVAIYTLTIEDIEHNSFLPSAFQHPIKLEHTKLENLLKKIRILSRSSIIDIQNNLFHPRNLKFIGEKISISLGNLKPDEVLLVVSQCDDIHSVLSNPTRNIFFIWKDKDGYNFVFGDVKHEIDRDLVEDAREWTRIDPISLTTMNHKDLILKEEFFEFKKINGYKNRRWIIVKESYVNELPGDDESDEGLIEQKSDSETTGITSEKKDSPAKEKQPDSKTEEKPSSDQEE